MNESLLEPIVNQRVSEMAENLVGSEIIKLAGEVKAKIKNGEKIYNLTIGDFNPNIFLNCPMFSISTVTTFLDLEAVVTSFFKSLAALI